jgi:hypothetical protein
LFRQSAQRSLRRFLNASFFCRCYTHVDSKVRESTQEPCSRFSRTPTNARIQTSEAVCILNRQRTLADATHALDRSATN